MKIHIDEIGYKSKPKDTVSTIKIRLQRDTPPRDFSMGELLKAIQEGRTISPAVMSGGASAEHWQEQQLFLVDIDNACDEDLARKRAMQKYDRKPSAEQIQGELDGLSTAERTPLLTLEDALAICKEYHLNPFLWYYSFSHSKEKPKFRLCFLLDVVCTDKAQRAIIAQTLISLFPQSDKSCKNADRIFYGTDKEVRICDAGARISMVDIMGVVPQSKRDGKPVPYNDKTQSTLDELKQSFDFLGFMTGEGLGVISTNANYTMFDHCPICGHKRDLVLYHDTKFLRCFHNDQSYSIVDYLMETRGLSVGDAIAYFKHDLCGVPREMYPKPKGQATKRDGKPVPYNVNPPADLPPYITSRFSEKKGEYTYSVAPPLLAEFIRQNTHYFFVMDNARGGVLKYWYRDGYYQLFSDEQIKGVIKQLITAFDISILKMKDVDEVFKDLCTDLHFIDGDEVNADENIINFQNGILHLDTMAFSPHSPEHFSTIQIPCEWQEVPIETPIFDGFMATLTGEKTATKGVLLEFLGVTLSNIKGWRMKKALFMVGAGDTGKSQLKSLGERLVGRRNFTGADLSELESRFGTAQLYNKRLAGSSDMSFMSVTELKTFKKATGGDALFAEFKGLDGFQFVYHGLLWFCMNELPKFGGDKGEWVYNRILVVRCNNVIPEEKRDKFLLDKMYSERDGIVQKAVFALQKVIQNGYEFSPSDDVDYNRVVYQMDNSTVASFYLECCVERPDGRIGDRCTCQKMFEVYKAWCSDNNKGFFENYKVFRNELSGLLGGSLSDVTTKRNGGTYFKNNTLSAEAKTNYVRVYGYDN